MGGDTHKKLYDKLVKILLDISTQCNLESMFFLDGFVTLIYC